MSDVLLDAAAGQASVRAALERHLAVGGDVYADPAAFRRFIDGGGNVGLYAAAEDALRDLYAGLRPRRALDLGCGDGRLTSALVGPGVDHLDLVEPSTRLLDAALARLAGLRWSSTGPAVAPHPMTAQQFLDRPDRQRGERWDVVQSTFALHALEPAARRSVLSALAATVGRLVIIEFDVPELADRSAEHAAYAVERYAAGIAEYAHDELVVRGFLVPVLVGQFDPAQPRHTWEQPVAAWASDLVEAGFRDVRRRHLHDYWWAPAHLIEASGRVSGHVNRRGWIVLTSIESDDRNLCVDFFEDPDGGFGFEQFRSDPEDGGEWTPISGYAASRYATLVEASERARAAIGWLTTHPRADRALRTWLDQV
ncbi:MAG TPA: methyltransferase domain-containing protein [Acidimicrobiales bacterium]|nr:methyltransferase domain-containing protein [Acidimicrobiales bacterium]